MYVFKLLQQEDKDIIIPFLALLKPDIGENILRERLIDMFKQGYQCVGAYDNDRVIGLSGLWILTKYYVGKHIEPDNVIIHPDYRGKKVGEEMMQWIYNYAISMGCLASELNCYVTNHGGQKFWNNQGYKIIGFHYQKDFGNVQLK